MSQLGLEGLRDEPPTEAQLERAEERCEEILDVDIETWFAPHPNGEAVLEAVEEEVDDPLAIEIAVEHHDGGRAMADDGDESEELILDELAQLWFEASRSSWEEVVSVVD